jgi:putative flippase GtrA
MPGQVSSPARGHGVPAPPGARGRGLATRILSPRVGAMLARNTLVSTFVFGIGLVVLWLLVNEAGMAQVPAAALGFVVSNTLHYVLGRSWIYRGSDRGLRSGYALFLANAGVGLVLTMGLYALLLHFTAIHYLIARVLVSLVAGLIVFLLNATVNFRQV